MQLSGPVCLIKYHSNDIIQKPNCSQTERGKSGDTIISFVRDGNIKQSNVQFTS